MKRYNSLVWLAAFYLLLLVPTRVTAQTIPAAEVQFVGPDLGAFAETTHISRVDIRTNGVEVTFDKRDGAGRWPDNTTPGWQGPLQYSLGLALQVGGRWVANAPIETWFGNNTIGGNITDQTLTCASGSGQIHCNWFYDGRWAPLNGVTPAPGVEMGMFVVAGDPRNDYTPVRERSDIVVIHLPAQNVEQTFLFPVAAPVPTPTPTPDVPLPPVVVPPVVPAPLPSTDYTFLLHTLQVVQTQLDAAHAELVAFEAREEAHWQNVGAAWKQVVSVLSPLVAMVAVLLRKGL